jgi:hypothetical protein
MRVKHTFVNQLTRDLFKPLAQRCFVSSFKVTPGCLWEFLINPINSINDPQVVTGSYR